MLGRQSFQIKSSTHNLHQQYYAILYIQFPLQVNKLLNQYYKYSTILIRSIIARLCNEYATMSLLICNQKSFTTHVRSILSNNRKKRRINVTASQTLQFLMFVVSYATLPPPPPPPKKQDFVIHNSVVWALQCLHYTSELAPWAINTIIKSKNHHILIWQI